MVVLATIVLATLIGATTSYAIRGLLARFERGKSPRWNDVGGLGLLGGLAGGFVLGEAVTGGLTWDFQLALWPGLFVGAFFGMLPSAGSLAGLGWSFFAVGAISGFLLGAILGGF